ncbi:MAG TPA: LapA family protein [Oligoflexia bacterium]|nr:LapA family protein [Oligoflexia bacterium]HMR25320.1 LapA family protein [Oligoflexia bacterium]
MKSIGRLLQLLLVFAVVTVFFFFFWENSQAIQIQFLHWMSPEHPLATSLLLAFCAGFALASIYFIVEVFRSKTKLRQKQKEIQRLQKEVDALRNNPLQKKLNNSTEISRSWVNDLEQSSASIQTESPKKNDSQDLEQTHIDSKPTTL